jgi:hypothetical protein
MVVLGLVIERPDQTPAWYKNVLGQRFPRARFGPSTAHNALSQMAVGTSPRVRRMRGGRYQAMPKGEAVFHSWMFRPPTANPAVRQALYGRIGLARLEDLPALLGVVRQEEVIATHLYERANQELREHEIRKRNRSGEDKTRVDFEREIHETWLYVGPLHWSSRATLCLMVLDRLEEIAQHAGLSLDAGEPMDGEHPQARTG